MASIRTIYTFPRDRRSGLPTQVKLQRTDRGPDHAPYQLVRETIGLAHVVLSDLSAEDLVLLSDAIDNVLDQSC